MNFLGKRGNVKQARKWIKSQEQEGRFVIARLVEEVDVKVENNPTLVMKKVEW